MSREKASKESLKASVTRRTVLSGAAAVGLSTMVRAQQPAEVKVGLIVPLSGIYTRPGQVMRMGAEMGIEHINAQGGVKSLGGAKLKLVVLDSGDTTEKAKNAAQRMVAQEDACPLRRNEGAIDHVRRMHRVLAERDRER